MRLIKASVLLADVRDLGADARASKIGIFLPFCLDAEVAFAAKK